MSVCVCARAWGSPFVFDACKTNVVRNLCQTYAYMCTCIHMYIYVYLYTKEHGSFSFVIGYPLRRHVFKVCQAKNLKIHQREVQRKHGVVLYTMLDTRS